MKLILASRSPRRRELLTAAGYEFEVLPARESAECGVCSGETPPELVARLAFQKAADIVEQVEEGLIIACDTVAAMHGQVFGKPENEDHARAILTTLMGKEHSVFSGLCLWQRPNGKPVVEVDETILRMADLSETQLDDYLASGLWEGKSGAFGYQDRHGWLEILHGSESNVVGLPMELFERMLGVIEDQQSH